MRLLVANLSFIAMGLSASILNVAWNSMQPDFGATFDDIAILLTVMTIGRLIANFTSGWLLTPLGMGRYLVAGSALAAVGFLGFALAPSWSALLAAGMLMGFGVGIINIGVNTAVASTYKSSRMNWLHGWYGVGTTIGPQLTALIIFAFGLSWRIAYGASFVLQLIITIVFLLTLRQWQQMDAERASQASDFNARPRDTLRLSAAWFSMIMFFLHAGSQIGTGQLTYALLVDGRSIDPAVAGTWISIYWGSLTIGRFLFGSIIDRIGSVLTLRISLFSNIIGALLLWWMPTDLVGLIGLIVIGFTLAPVLPTLTAQTPGRVGLAHAGNVIGFQAAASSIGWALLPGTAALLAQHIGLGMIGLYLTVLAVVSFIFHDVYVTREARSLAMMPTPDKQLKVES